MPLRPLGDRVLIKPAKSPDQTESGLHLPENRSDQYVEMQGTVVAVGTPRHPLKDAAEDVANFIESQGLVEDAELVRDLVRREPCVQPGDDVLFSWSVGQQVTVDDEVYLLLRESDLLAVLESEPM